MNPVAILTGAQALEAILTIAQQTVTLYKGGHMTATQMQAVWNNIGLNLTTAEELFKQA